MNRKAYRIKRIGCIEFVLSLIWWPIGTFTLYVNTRWFDQGLLGSNTALLSGIIITCSMCCAAICLHQSVNTKFSAKIIRYYFWLSCGSFLLAVSATNLLLAPMPRLLYDYPKVWFALALSLLYRGVISYLLLEELEEENCQPLMGTEEERIEVNLRTIADQSSDTCGDSIAAPN